MTFIRIAEFDWLPGQHEGCIFENYSKTFLVILMKMKLCFYCQCPTAFVALATYMYNFYRLIKEKVEIGYLCFIV